MIVNRQVFAPAGRVSHIVLMIVLVPVGLGARLPVRPVKGFTMEVTGARVTGASFLMVVQSPEAPGISTTIDSSLSQMVLPGGA